MTESFTRRVANLHALLDAPLRDTNDLVALMLAGEELRRAAEIQGQLLAEAHSELDRYDLCVRDLARAQPNLFPKGLDGDLEQALGDLIYYANTPRPERTLEEGDDALRRIDEVLEVAVAAVRAGALDRVVLEGLAIRASTATASLVLQLEDLADIAEQRGATLGPDPEYPGVYDWRYALASQSTASLVISLGAVHQARMADLVAKMNRVFGTGRVIEIRFRRPKQEVGAQIRLAAASAGRLDDDPGHDAPVVEQDDRFRIQHFSAASSGALFGLRVSIPPESPADLSSDEAIAVLVGGIPISPVQRGLQRPLVWTALFGAPGDFDLLREVEVQIPQLGFDKMIRLLEEGTK